MKFDASEYEALIPEGGLTFDRAFDQMQTNYYENLAERAKIREVLEITAGVNFAEIRDCDIPALAILLGLQYKLRGTRPGTFQPDHLPYFEVYAKARQGE